MKVNQLNSTFDIVDNVSSTINGVSNKISSFVMDGVSKVIDKKGKKKDHFPEQVKGFGRMSAEARCLPQSLHHDA